MQIAFGLYPRFTALDAIGPYQVLSNLPGADVVIVADQAGILTDDNELLRIDVERTFEDVPSPDVLVVPGGMITHRLAEEGGPIVEWIRSAHEQSVWTTSVCVGSLLLGAAGVLKGRTATTHWLSYDRLASYGASPSEQRVVIDGRIITGAGVSAGIDMALVLVEKLASADVARAIQLGIEYDPQPPFDSGAPSTAPAHIRDLVTTMMHAAEDAILADEYD